MADVVRPQVRTRSRRARRVVNFSQIPQLDHVRRDLNAERTYAVGQKGKREKRLPITLLIETAISSVGECPSWILTDTERNDGKADKKKKWREEYGDGKSGKAGMSGGDRLEREKENVINLAVNNKLS